MTRKTSIFIFLGLIFTFTLWMMDRSSLVAVSWRKIYFEFSIPEAMLFLLVIFAVIDFITRIIRRVQKAQLKEVYRTSVFNDNTDENAAIDVLAGKISEKMIINRHDFDNSMLLVLQAMTSITAGDMKEARSSLNKLKKIIGNDPIIDVLKMKIYKGEKDFDKMEKLSAKLVKNENVQLIGLKAAVEAQTQKKEFKEALESVNKAYELRQDLYWVIESAFELRAKAKDWDGALQVLEAGLKKKMVSKFNYNRSKAIVLLEMANEFKAKEDDVNFFRYASQSLDTDPTLVPAAVALAHYYKNNDNQIRKASHVLMETWRRNPVDVLAYEYLALNPEDDLLDKIKKVESLAQINGLRPSLNNLLIAELAIQGGLWKKAKAEIDMFIINNPCTKKICELMAIYEEKGNNNKKAAAEWRKRIDQCDEDAAWVCDDCGHASHEWEAVCEQCGAFATKKWHLYLEKFEGPRFAEVSDEIAEQIAEIENEDDED